MKRVILLFEFVLLSLGSIFVHNTQAGQPKIVIPQSSWDFGYIPTGGAVSHYYLVKNSGTDTLKIQNVKPG